MPADEPKQEDLETAAPEALVKRLSREAHLYLAFTEEWPEETAGASDEEEAVLPAEELARYERFLHPAPKRTFLTGRVLARTALSRYAPVAAADWRFRIEEHGRPEIDAPPGIPPLRFNLAHTDSLVACVVTLDRACGVDVEDRRRRLNPLPMAKHSFTPRETADLEKLDGDERLERFLRLWTLKEAYLKARGTGITLRLNAAEFSFAPGPAAVEELKVGFSERAADREAAWQFDLFRVAGHHRLALALCRGDGPRLQLVTHKVDPDGTLARPPELEALASNHPAAD